MTDPAVAPSVGPKPVSSLLRVMAKDTAVSLAARVVTLALGMVFTAYAARHLGVEAWGVLSGALAFVTLFQVLGDLGLTQVATREVARDRSLAATFVGNAAAIKAVLSALLALGVVAVALLLGYSDTYLAAVGILVLHVVFTSYSNLAYGLFQAYQRLEYRALGQVLHACLMLAGAIVAARASWGVQGFAGVYAVSALVVLFYSSVVIAKEFALPRVLLGVRDALKAIRTGLPFAATIFLSGFFLRIDVIILTVFVGSVAAGLYNAAATIITVITFIAEALVLATYPVMSRLFVSDAYALKRGLDRVVKYLLFVGAPLAVGVFALSSIVVGLVFGPEYAESSHILRILCILVPIRFMSYGLGWALPAIDLEHLRSVTWVLVAGSNIALDLFLVPRVGLSGAAIGCVVSQAFLMLGYYYFVASRFHRLQILPALWQCAAGIAAMGLLVWVLKPQIGLLLSVAVGSLGYLLALVALGAFDRRDLQVLRSAVGRG